MKWREPKIKGMVTPKNILFAIGLIFLISIPFGFLGGNGKFNHSIYLLAAGFMSFATIGLFIAPLLPGTQVQLTEDAVVRKMSRRNEKSSYKNISRIYFSRDCSYSWNGSQLIINPEIKNTGNPPFACFRIILKNDVIKNGKLEFSYSTFNSVHQFMVPNEVNVDQILQLLRDKGVNLIEGELPSDYSAGNDLSC